MFIYFRCCEKQATISNVKRFNNISKTELLKRCWLSIQQSVNSTDTIIIIHDSVSLDTLVYLQKTCRTQNIIIIEVPEHSWDYHLHTVKLIDTLAKYTKEYPNELHYIVEDDYLHTDNAIRVLQNNLKSWNYFAASYDYPDRYIGQPESCFVVLGQDRHWRSVNSSTMTLLALGSTWINVIDILYEAAPTSNDKVFDEIFKKIPCISPLPGVSSHMTDYHATPLVDWEDIWDFNEQ